MTKLGCAALCFGLLVGLRGEAFAQRSLFDPPAAEAPPAAAPPAGEAQPKARPRPRKKAGPTPARSLAIQNASANTLTALEVSAEGKSAKLSKPLKPKARTTLRLPAYKACAVTVAATFESVGQAEPSEFDICKDKLIRFTD